MVLWLAGCELWITRFESHTLNQQILTTTRKSICYANNPKTPLGVVKGGIAPGEYWQIDFSELCKGRCYKYVLVLVDTFSGCAEVFHCCTSWARDVVKNFNKRNNYLIWNSRGFSFRQHFIEEVVQGLSYSLWFKGDLHTPWRKQSNEKEERLDQTIKTNSQILDRGIICCFTENPDYSLCPSEILYGRLHPINTVVMKGDQMHIWKIMICWEII